MTDAELEITAELVLDLVADNGSRGLPGGKPSWGPPARAALHRLIAHHRHHG